jgi:hypothetical protein
MPLKVADCRHGTQLWDVATQQGSLVKGLDSDSAAEVAQADQQQQARQEAGSTLLGSAAVQALDYALLNGAHIVLAGWSAGELISSSSGSSAGQCFMGAASTIAQGLNAASAADGSGCVAAVQRELFLDALKPLQEAGVLVVTMQDSASIGGASAVAADAGVHLPCSLSCDLDNVVCVMASTVVLPPNGSRAGLTDVLSAAEFFAPLTSQHSSSYYGLTLDEDLLEQKSEGDSSKATSSAAGGDAAAASATGSLKLAALSCDQRGGRTSGTWAQLRAPGTDILAGWAWGSHAVVSGSSAAASVTAGVAALAWSRLGQTLGADVSPGAFEGLGQQVKQELLQGSSISTRSGGTDAAAGVAAISTAKRSSIMNRAPGVEHGSDGAMLELDLFGTLQQSSRAPDAVALHPAVLSPGVTSVSKSLRYTWHIQGDDSGPYDTNAMWYAPCSLQGLCTTSMRLPAACDLVHQRSRLV